MAILAVRVGRQGPQSSVLLVDLGRGMGWGAVVACDQRLDGVRQHASLFHVRLWQLLSQTVDGRLSLQVVRNTTTHSVGSTRALDMSPPSIAPATVTAMHWDTLKLAQLQETEASLPAREGRMLSVHLVGSVDFKPSCARRRALLQTQNDLRSGIFRLPFAPVGPSPHGVVHQSTRLSKAAALDSPSTVSIAVAARTKCTEAVLSCLLDGLGCIASSPAVTAVLHGPGREGRMLSVHLVGSVDFRPSCARRRALLQTQGDLHSGIFRLPSAPVGPSPSPWCRASVHSPVQSCSFGSYNCLHCLWCQDQVQGSCPVMLA